MAGVEDSLDHLHKIDFEFLASEPLARRLEAIAVDLHVATMFIAAGSDFSNGKVWGGEKRERLRSGGLKHKPPLQTGGGVKTLGVSLSDRSNHN